jgi:hypothetical protein
LTRRGSALPSLAVDGVERRDPPDTARVADLVLLDPGWVATVVMNDCEDKA